MNRKVSNVTCRITLWLCVACAISGAFFLLKGEDSAWFVGGSSGWAGTRGVSAFTYYFVWPESKRAEASKKDDLASALGSFVGGPSTPTIGQRVERNIWVAIVLGIASVMLGSASAIIYFSRDKGGRESSVSPLSKRLWPIKRRNVALLFACVCVTGLAGWYLISRLQTNAWISQLRDPNSDARQDAADALRDLQDPRAVEPLVAALDDPNHAVRKHAAWALGNIKDARAVEPLIIALKEPDLDVQMAVVRALGEIKDLRAVGPLIAALKDGDRDVQMMAAIELGEIKDSRAVEPLIAALKDADPKVQIPAAVALGNIKDPRAVEPLTTALEGSNYEVRARASDALQAIGTPAGERSTLPDGAGRTAEPTTGILAVPVPSISTERFHEPEMVRIPAGSLPMGMSPPHLVTFHEFLMADYPVTRGEFAAFVRAKGERPAASWWPWSRGCYGFVGSNKDDLKFERIATMDWRNGPGTENDRDRVVCVSYDDAVAYAAWLSEVSGNKYRLPRLCGRISPTSKRMRNSQWRHSWSPSSRSASQHA
jgi:hypothetical protein